MNYDQCRTVEAAEAFDRDMAEDAVNEALGGVAIFPSRVPGVVAFERIEDRDWDELATRLAEAVGHPVACIATADWNFDESNDEEAVFVAFAIPSLPGDYAEDHRNLMTPRAVPSI
jgi:hypothetical protein